MAHLLGSEACLESLKQDVNDVQTTVMDLLSRVGHLRSPSWKYPDKVACELDIDELLERYSYSSDEDHCKLSHIILFELLIDRYFFIQIILYNNYAYILIGSYLYCIGQKMHK